MALDGLKHALSKADATVFGPKKNLSEDRESAQKKKEMIQRYVQSLPGFEVKYSKTAYKEVPMNDGRSLFIKLHWEVDMTETRMDKVTWLLEVKQSIRGNVIFSIRQTQDNPPSSAIDVEKFVKNMAGEMTKSFRKITIFD